MHPYRLIYNQSLLPLILYERSEKPLLYQLCFQLVTNDL